LVGEWKNPPFPPLGLIRFFLGGTPNNRPLLDPLGSIGLFLVGLPVRPLTRGLFFFDGRLRRGGGFLFAGVLFIHFFIFTKTKTLRGFFCLPENKRGGGALGSKKQGGGRFPFCSKPTPPSPSTKPTTPVVVLGFFLLFLVFWCSGGGAIKVFRG